MLSELLVRPERTCSTIGKSKICDLHPKEPWILASLYSGTVYIWNYHSQVLNIPGTFKVFKVAESPVRSAKFIACKQWIVTGADDKTVAVHPTLPYVLSASDDMLIKLWDWEKGWECTQNVPGTFRLCNTACFQIWNLSSPAPDFTLDGHSKGVNCIDYFMRGSKPYLISGSDDHTAKVWDYEAKSCVQTLEGHTNNVSAVCVHPELPLIITGSEDGNVHIWDGATYRLENTLNYGFERVWAFGCMKGSNRIVIGYDKGTIMVKVLRSHIGVPWASGLRRKRKRNVDLYN
ncbi:Coatomer subunit beta'-2 [Vitis vinifera]|uniref:Coatomer subunit beta'-2 n=1 Tax=Vitis vinifera TaxID=29760 RepID=A0A438E0Z9_VITVI|nr:Coatomer subunit beta'-2 [Vitis vinifera]